MVNYPPGLHSWLELATLFSEWVLLHCMKTLLIPVGVILFFRRQVISWSNSLFCVTDFSGQELDSMVYTMTVAMGNSYWPSYYLWNSQRKAFLRKTTKLVKGCFQEGMIKACPRFYQKQSAPERVSRTGRTTWIETILPQGAVLQYYIIPSSVTLLHFGDYLTKGHTCALEILSTHE